MTDTLWFYSKDESTTFNANIVYNNNFKSFDYKSKLLKDMLLMAIIEFQKILSNFWRSLDHNNVVLTITDRKLYVPVITLSVKVNQKFVIF